MEKWPVGLTASTKDNNINKRKKNMISEYVCRPSSIEECFNNWCLAFWLCFKVLTSLYPSVRYAFSTVELN